MHKEGSDQITGILLAAGRGARFDPSGIRNKLLQPLTSGDKVVAASAKNMLQVLPNVLAVVRPGNDAVALQLRSLGYQVTECPTADQGMGASLAYGLAQVSDAAGWVIALGDMPHVQPATFQRLIEALSQGADIAVPTYQGKRGNPVAFSRLHLPQLLQLGGDRGARNLLLEFPMTEVTVDDAGILRDIDTQADLS
jgi:molybdenum cofactor cytidylyltransferase